MPAPPMGLTIKKLNGEKKAINKLAISVFIPIWKCAEFFVVRLKQSSPTFIFRPFQFALNFKDF